MTLFNLRLDDKLLKQIKHDAIDNGESIKTAVMSGRYSENKPVTAQVTPILEPISIDKPAPAKKTVIGPITKDKKRIPLTF